MSAKAVVNLAPSREPLYNELHSGTYYLALAGTHDDSPSVKTEGSIAAFEAVRTNAPKILVLMRGFNHERLGVAQGNQSALVHAEMYTTLTMLTPPSHVTPRNYLVREFLRWVLFGEYNVGAELFVDRAAVLAFGEDAHGSPAAGWVGPRHTPVLLRSPASDAEFLPTNRMRELYVPGGDIEAVSASVLLLEIAGLGATGDASDIDVETCTADPPVPAEPPRSAHGGMALFVSWDREVAPASDVVIRFPLATTLDVLLNAILPLDNYSLVAEIALHVNASLNVDNFVRYGSLEWYPSLGLGDADGVQAWSTGAGGPLLYAWGYPCPLPFSNNGPTADRRQTVLSTIGVRLSVLAPAGLGSVTHAYLNLESPGFVRGQAAITRVGIVLHE